MPRIALGIHDDTPCPGCGYNLRGLRLDGRCPECGRPATDSFARPIHHLNGHFAESMILRPAAWIAVMAGLGVAVRGIVSISASPQTWLVPLALLSALAGLYFAFVVAGDVRFLRSFKGSRPLRERAAIWRGLCVVSGLGAGSLPLWPVLVPEGPLVWVAVYVGAGVSGVAAAGMGAAAGHELLERHSLRRTHARAWLLAVVGLTLAMLAPLAPLPVSILAAIAMAGALVAGLAVWAVAAGLLIATLRHAQGPVVSL